MKVLHYTLGLPPYRSGGLVNYSLSLMKQQCSTDEVSLLYPGNYDLRKRSYIVSRGTYQDIHIYEIKNPVLVPLLHGIKDPSYIFSHKQFDLDNFERILAHIQPDVLHIHTFMGLDPDLLEYVKKQRVLIVYTTHDYFGLCPRVNFIDQAGKVCDGKGDCALCNISAPRKEILYLRNNSFILKYKSFFRRFKNSAAMSPVFSGVCTVAPPDSAAAFDKLKRHYHTMFSLVDIFHFNSELAREIYTRILPGIKGKTAFVTLGNIRDHRKIKTLSSGPVRLGYIGSMDTYKGFPLLYDVLSELYSNNKRNWKLSVYGNKAGSEKLLPNVKIEGFYTRNEMESVFENIDLLIVPSVWYETFGLTVLEAFSFGVPVLVSRFVGAKDVVREYDENFIFSDRKELREKLSTILENPSLLSAYNRIICEKPFDYTIEGHAGHIKKLYLQN